MFIQLLVHLFPLWLDILHLKIMLLASTCVSLCGWGGHKRFDEHPPQAQGLNG